MEFITNSEGETEALGVRLAEALARLPLFHFDMYRLGSSDELFDIGWEDYLARGGVCAVEWSENVAGALEEGAILVDICRGALDGQRIVSIEGVEL